MTQIAIFAAGCFWGVQDYIDHIDGVLATRVGYTGGSLPNPTYEDVCYNNTGHAEALEIKFDDSIVSYETLLRQFLYLHDPTQVGGQGPDIGDQYRSAIFYTNDNQKTKAEQILKEASKEYSKPIATEITSASTFYEAEDYHQKFVAKTGRGACHRPFKKM